MKKWIYPLFILFIFTGLVISCSDDDNGFWASLIPETDDEPTQSQINGYVFKPAVELPTDENIAQLQLPDRFAIQKFAKDLGESRMMVVSDAGHVYVSLRREGQVLLLEDSDNDGTADRKETVASIDQAHGLSIHNNKLYIVAVRKVFAADINPDGTLQEPQMLTDELPDGGQHPNRTIDFGPDGMMYITVGSTCNSCQETNDMNATIVKADADAQNMAIFATGLRNTIGFGWHPETNEMWGMDHGIDWLGDTQQEEELNKLVEGADYGWPYIFGDGNYNPGDRPPGDMTYQEYLEQTTLPVLTYTAHAAPLDMVFYTGDNFPEEYKHDAFIAMRGSWNRSNPVGYKIVRLQFENGQPTAFEDFVTGFLIKDNKAHFGRLAGLAVLNDGTLLVSDDTNGVIYRIYSE